MAYEAKIRLYVEQDLSEGGQITLDKDQTHYLANVMRIAEGTVIALFNGWDGEWLATVTEATRKKVCLNIQRQSRPQKDEPDLWLIFAPIKKARIDYIAQKATELGVARLMPAITHRTIMSKIKVEKLAANAREAAEQCERLNVPECFEPQKLSKILKNWPSRRKIMFCDEDLSGKAASEVLQSAGSKGEPWAIIIGPEGGFDDEERAMIHNHPNSYVVSLGPRILRAETAAVAAITLWQSSLGDW